MTDQFEQQPGGNGAPKHGPAAEGIPFIITQKMKVELAARGFTHAQIRNMTPEQARLSLGETSSPRPTALEPRLGSIPAELTQLPHWVLWKYEPPEKPDGKWRKVPYQTNGEYKASTTNRRTWSTFETCCAAYERGGFDGVGFVFDGAVGPDGYCLVGTDFDHCIDDKRVQPLAGKRITRLDSYTELSPSGTGFHSITRAKPLDRIVKFGGVEIYCRGRYFTFTGRCLNQGQQIRAAAAEVDELIAEVRAKEAAEKPNKSTAGWSNGGAKATGTLFGGAKVAAAFAQLDPNKGLGAGIDSSFWYDRLTPEQKDEVVDHALEVIVAFLEKSGGHTNDLWYRLTTAVARSGAPHAEDIFVKHTTTTKNPEPEDFLRNIFARCQGDPRPEYGAISVGTLLGLARDHGADFEPWRRHEDQQKGETPPKLTWDPAELKVSFSNIPHRKWVYGTYLLRGEVTLLVSPGGVGKTALATGMTTEIATNTVVLGENIWGTDLKVLSINGEDGKTEAERRVLAFLRAHKLKEEPPDRLYVMGSDDERVQQMSLLQTNGRSNPSLNMAGFAILKSALDALRPDVLTIDPLVVFCGGVSMSDNAMMALVIRGLKILAVAYNCAILVVHHTKKGGEPGDQETISGAAAIANLARRALMPVPMTEGETRELGVLPSERNRYFKLMDAKASFAPKSADSPWYELHNTELSNPEPPLYPYGDRVQAVGRVELPLPKTTSEAADNPKIQKAILDLVDLGKLIDEEWYPYSPSSRGRQNERAILEDAVAAAKNATAPQQWLGADLRAVVQHAINRMKSDGWIREEAIKATGRFRRKLGLCVDWERTPWSVGREVEELLGAGSSGNTTQPPDKNLGGGTPDAKG